MDKALKENNFKKYFIEYQGFMSNHISQGIIALDRLGADEQRVERFVQWYKGRLESPDDHGDLVVPADTDVDSLLGARKGYYQLLEHYEKELPRVGSPTELVRQNWPCLAPGMVCAALHGLIQTGYHLAVNDDKGVCEGIAYTHYSYKPVVYNPDAPENLLANFGKGTRSVVSVIEEIRTDSSMREKMLADAEEFRALPVRGIGLAQSRLVSVCAKQGDRMISLINQLAIPDFKSNPARVLGDLLVHTAMTAYQASARRNDFFLLHGVTGAWSLRNVFKCNLSEEDLVKSTRYFLCCLLATYMCQDTPKLEHTVGEYDVNDQTWQAVIDKALASDFDEHIFKLVQVCHDMWKEDPTGPNGNLYMACAHVAVDIQIRHAEYVKKDVPFSAQ